MPSRRLILAAAAAFAAPVRWTLARVRGVYDLDAYAEVSGPTWLSCDDAVASRSGASAVVSVSCRTQRGVKIPRRGAVVSMAAEVEYAESSEEIGTCNASSRIKKAGQVTLSCEVPLPEEPALPIVIEGDGTGVTETFRVPSGVMVMETTVSVLPERYGRIEMTLGNGYTIRLWESYPYLEHTGRLVEEVWEGSEAIIESTVPGPWRMTISEAFP